MPYYEFEKNDIFKNRVKTHPHCNFFLYNGQAYYNNQSASIGKFSHYVKGVPSGYVSLYELNVDRDIAGHTFESSGQTESGTKTKIFPYVTKDSGLSSFSTVSTSDFNSDFAYGDMMMGNYPLSASITYDRFTEGQGRPPISALRTTLDYYKPLSNHYAYNSSFGNKASQEMGLISIPSIFYGSSIKKGSVSLKFYVTGTLIGELQDKNRNGELFQVSGSAMDHSGSNEVAGTILYNEGFIILTGSWDMKPNRGDGFMPFTGDPVTPKWIYFGQTISGSALHQTAGNTMTASSYDLSFQGTQYVETITMFANAPQAQMNHSNNHTYRSYGDYMHPLTSSTTYVEASSSIKNVASSSYNKHTASFEKITYISKIGIYDKNKNLIAIAKLAKPLRKREVDDYTFKMKLDI